MEFGKLGFNALTVSLVGTAIFTIAQFWGLVKQSKKIRQYEAGDSVSVSMYIFGFGSFFTSLLMGIHDRSIALIFNGALLTFMEAWVIRDLWVYKGFARSEKLAGCALALFCLTDLVLPHKYLFFFFLGMGQALAQGLQGIEIIRKKDAGLVEIRTLFAFYLANWFWTIYAFAADNLPLKIVGGLSILLLTMTCMAWFWYKAPEPEDWTTVE